MSRDLIDFRARPEQDIIEYAAAADRGDRRQSLAGFEDDYTDIVDYIVRSTHKMWEGGGIGRLYQHYAHNTVVWSDWGYTYGRDRTMEYVYQRRVAFPDLRLYADEVIWTGDETAGFRTSHRITWTGHNDGWSRYGPPTGRRIQMRGIANCVVRQNRVVEEWLSHDELTLVRQLGLNVDDALRVLVQQAERDGVWPAVGQVERGEGQLAPEPFAPRNPGGFDVEDLVRGSWHEIWAGRRLDRVRAYYAPTFVCHGPSGRELYGRGDYEAFLLSLLAAFPDAHVQIDDLYWNGSETEGYRTAVRWTLVGTHRGVSVYGPPTGRRVKVLGSTQHRIVDGRFAEEHTIFNELALLAQLRYGAG